MPSSPNYVRDLKREYKLNGGTKAAKKRRAGNNKARRKLIRLGRVRKGDGKDVAHQDNNTSNNSLSNLKVQSRATNRSFKRDKRAKRLGGASR